MSAKNTTIYIFVVVFSDVCRLEILVSVSSLLPSENSIAGIGFSDSQADPLFWRLQSRRMECGRIYISHPQACQQISPSDFCACTGFFSAQCYQLVLKYKIDVIQLESCNKCVSRVCLINILNQNLNLFKNMSKLRTLPLCWPIKHLKSSQPFSTQNSGGWPMAINMKFVKQKYKESQKLEKCYHIMLEFVKPT